MKASILILLFLLVSGLSFAQYNKIRESDILYKERIVRSVNLKNSVNDDLFSKENGLVQLLLDAYEKGEITGYLNDDLKETLSLQDFRSKVKVGLSEEDTQTYTASQLYMIEIGEDLIFDRNRSEIIFDMEALTVFIPEEINHRKLLEPAVSFKFDDCIKIFRNDPRANAFNPLRNGRSINFSEVFLLRLFNSQIVKIGHDLYFDQMYSNPTLAFVARKDAENQLTEYLYKLYNPQ